MFKNLLISKLTICNHFSNGNISEQYSVCIEIMVNVTKQTKKTNNITVFKPVTVILEKPIRIPRFLSVKASHVLKGFLNKVNYILLFLASNIWKSASC